MPLVGSGGIEKLDAGTLVLSGANRYTGGTLVSGGTLVGNTSSLQGTLTNNANLVFAQANDGTFNGVLRGTGTTIKRGFGRLLLLGNHPFSGLFNVDQGTLQVGDAANPRSLLAARVNVAPECQRRLHQCQRRQPGHRPGDCTGELPQRGRHRQLGWQPHRGQFVRWQWSLPVAMVATRCCLPTAVSMACSPATT